MEEEKVVRKPHVSTALQIDKEEIKDEVESGQPDKYYKKFDFFYKRTCFRLMAEFYKLTFQPYQRQWVDQRRRTDLNELIKDYAKRNFG